ncbi:hypothetical protein [Alienimonas chondri]|uniref:Carboxypeptidase regulatory-like domain-containing protein n=1 Tax=Alienimonas chondri TaxID=2681879 RepID=A0ABX1VBS7_9PLAN|nr:hypothetical protein [Alienimonas chondri]NNJ25406.1 hypothetical protein [Alienimonas chondri]
MPRRLTRSVRLASLLAGLALATGAGCSGESHSAPVPLTGKLVEGTDPRGGVRLSFWKADGPVGGASASVITGPDGTFSLPVGPEAAPGVGLPAGQYKVTVERFMSPLSAGADPDVKQNEGAPPLRNIAPEQFQNRTTTPLSVTAPGEGVLLDLSA